MKPTPIPHVCEQALAEAIADVATELRLVNVIDLIGYVHGQRYANIEDLIHSSAELYFKQGALRYAWSADLDVVWDALPTISLNMEFCWSGVTAFFNLCLNGARAGVDLQHLVFDSKPTDEQEKRDRLKAALADSRMSPPRRAETGVNFKDASS